MLYINHLKIPETLSNNDLFDNLCNFIIYLLALSICFSKLGNDRLVD